MSDKVRELLIYLAIGAAISMAVLALNLSREYGMLRSLCDGFFTAAVLLLGIGGIKAARNKGAFDVSGFGLRHVVDMAVPAFRREEKEDLQQYRERKALERKSSAGLLLAGGVYLALAVIALVVYELAVHKW